MFESQSVLIRLVLCTLRMFLGEIPYCGNFPRFPHSSGIPVAFQSHSSGIPVAFQWHSKEQVRQEQREKNLEEKKSSTAVEFLVFVQFLGFCRFR